MLQRNNLIVNYLPPSYRDLELRKLFQPYGNILQAKVICSKTTNESLTYGFVMFEREEDATRAVQELNGFYIFGKQLKVSIARPRNGGGKGCKLHVSKLPAHFTWEMVNSLFAQFGEIIELRVLADEFGNSRQVAFVQYGHRQESDAALSALSGYVLPGADSGLVIKYATQHKPKSNSDSDDLNFEYFGFALSPTTDPSLPWSLPQTQPPAQAQYPSSYLHQPSPPPPQLSSPQYPQRAHAHSPLMESGNRRSNPSWNTEAPSLSHPSAAALHSTPSSLLSNHCFETNDSFDFRAYLPSNNLTRHPLVPTPSQIPHPLGAPPVTPNLAAPVASTFAENPFRLQSFPMSNSPMTESSTTSSSSASTTPLSQHRPFFPTTATATATATSTTLLSISNPSTSSHSSVPIGSLGYGSAPGPASFSHSSGSTSGPSESGGSCPSSSAQGSSGSQFSTSGFGSHSGRGASSSSSIFDCASISETNPGLDFRQGREYLVSLQQIKSFQDVFSFPFVSSFGKVLEAKFVESFLPNGEKLFSIQFLVMPFHPSHIQQLQYFQNSSILYEGVSLNLYIEEHQSANRL